MGPLLMLSYRHYWLKAAQCGDNFALKTMCRDRFLAILWYFHFGDNDETYNNRLGKVTYLVDYLNNTMEDIYVP